MKKRYIVHCRKITPRKRDTFRKHAKGYMEIKNSEDSFVDSLRSDAEYSVELDENGLSEFKSASNLLSIEPVGEKKLLSDGIPVQVERSFHKLDTFYENRGPKFVRVAVIDTGLGAGCYDKHFRNSVVAQRSWVGDSALAADHPHGSHCAGSALPEGAGLLVGRVFGSGGDGARDDHIVAAMYWAVDNGADAISLSLGGSGGESTFERAAQYARSRRCQVFAAMGNDGTNERQFPAACPSVQAVIAYNAANGQIAWFSNWGDWAEFSGSGVNVESFGLDGERIFMNGTSMATPNVVQVFASLRQDVGKGVLTAMRKSAYKPPVDFEKRGFGIPQGLNARRYLEIV